MSIERAVLEASIKDTSLSPATLQQAFERFSEASTRLAAKYEILREEAEELRARLKEKDQEIARQARLAMLGETAAAIAHEVRNPLGSIKLFASLLKQDLEDRPESKKLAAEIEKSVSNLEMVVSNILQFAKNKRLSLSPVNLHSLIQEQVACVVPQSGDLKVSMDLQGAPFIRGNEQGIRQIVHNLLLNAMQAMRYKGGIDIEAADRGQSEVVIIIKDSGPGIPQEILEKLFDPFVTGRAEGTGLGLAIVRQIVNQHQGSVSARNAGGAIFEIRLPRYPQEE